MRNRIAAFALACLALPLAWSQASQSIVSALRGKQYAEALNLAEQALKAAPRDVQILTLEGLALKGLGRDQDALAPFERALRVNPDYLAALEGAAQIEYAAAGKGAVPLLDHLLK